MTLLPQSSVVYNSQPVRWGWSTQNAQNALSPPPTRPAGYLPTRTTPHGPSRVAHGPGIVFLKHCTAPGPLKISFFGGNIWTEMNPLALQRAPSAGPGRSDLPLGSFKHTKGGQTVLWAHKYTPNGHLPRTGGSSASKAKVTVFVAVLVTNTSVHVSRLCGHQ